LIVAAGGDALVVLLVKAVKRGAPRWWALLALEVLLILGTRALGLTWWDALVGGLGMYAGWMTALWQNQRGALGVYVAAMLRAMAESRRQPGEGPPQ
jgi:type IV secretory pathway TraG/TraD family ATPase VirD4